MAFVGDYQMIVYGDSQGPGGGDNLAGQLLVAFGRFKASGWVIMLCAVISYVEFLQF